MAQLELLNTPPGGQAPMSFESPDAYIALDSSKAPSSRVAAPKIEGAYKTISEVADELDVPQHVLRFWESHFPQVKPLRMRGDRRYYRPEDIDLLGKIKTLLYTQGYTIKGAKKVVRNKSFFLDASPVAALPEAAVAKSAKPAEKKAPKQDVEKLVSELRTLKAILATVL